MNDKKLRTLLVCGVCPGQSEAAELVSACKSLGRDGVYGAAKKGKILPFAAKTLTELGLDTDFWNGVLSQYRQRNCAIVSLLDRAYEALEQTGVKKMFVSENFGALLSAGGDLALFASSDVDNYAPIEEKEKIYAAMERLGWRKQERFAGKRQIAAEFFPSDDRLPQNFYFSVDFYPLARLKLPCFIDGDRFVDWNGLTCYRDTHIALAPREALTYICLMHTSLHSFCRAPDTRLYVDLRNLETLRPDCDVIARWCRRDGTCVRAAVAAELSNRLMGTRYPPILTEGGNRAARLVSRVYDADTGCLANEPGRLEILKIDMMCDDVSDGRGLKKMLFPDRAWMASVYGGSGVSAHLRHFRRMI